MNQTEKDQPLDSSSFLPSVSDMNCAPMQMSQTSAGATKVKKLNLASFLGNCLCEPFQFVERTRGQSEQFVELHSVKFIGLGAVEDELTPRERVYDTLQQLTTRTERLISIGYLLDEPRNEVETSTKAEARKATEAIPLDIWNQNYPNDQSMSNDVKTTILQIKNKEYASTMEEMLKTLAAQKKHPNRTNNRYMCGITAHNLGVMRVLAGADDEATPIFKQAIALKTASFGPDHPEVALSWDELGIQLFARGDFESSLSAFHEAHNIRSKQEGSSSHPNLAMVLNNIACCYFQMGNHRTALLKLQEASEIQHKAVGSSAQADLDLLHVAIVVCNCGYLNLALKQYEEAQSLFEEALLIQQSVLNDNHRAIRDTLSNIAFTNAFHS